MGKIRTWWEDLVGVDDAGLVVGIAICVSGVRLEVVESACEYNMIWSGGWLYNEKAWVPRGYIVLGCEQWNKNAIVSHFL